MRYKSRLFFLNKEFLIKKLHFKAKNNFKNRFLNVVRRSQSVDMKLGGAKNVSSHIKCLILYID